MDFKRVQMYVGSVNECNHAQFGGVWSMAYTLNHAYNTPSEEVAKQCMHFNESSYQMHIQAQAKAQ